MSMLEQSCLLALYISLVTGFAPVHQEVLSRRWILPSDSWTLDSSTSTALATTTTQLRSSVGGGGGSPGGPGGEEGDSKWDDFFREEESDNMMKAREYFSENSLPINFDENGNAKESKDSEKTELPEASQNSTQAKKESSALVRPGQDSQLLGGDAPTADMLASNPYMAVVSQISPSDLISKFTSSAHPRVQNAVRSTILSLIGGLPKMAFDTTTITTGKRLASLMFQLQMTGYMFKNGTCLGKELKWIRAMHNLTVFSIRFNLPFSLSSDNLRSRISIIGATIPWRCQRYRLWTQVFT